MRVRRAFLALACFAVSVASRADVLASNTNAGGGQFRGYFDGQAFTIGGSGAYDDIVFSFQDAGYDGFGTGFLLSQQYLGTPGNLSASTPGFLGSASASGASFTFSSALTLQAGTTYYLFTSGAGWVIPSYTPNGSYYYYSSGGSFAESTYASSVFSVTGDALPLVTATPEPSSLVLLATGLAGAVGTVRRRVRLRA